MMARLAEWMLRRPVAWGVVVATGLVAVVFTSLAARVPRKEGVLAFLPRDNPTVRTFYRVNRQFGGLDLAIVGLEAPRGGDVFRAPLLRDLRTVTRRLEGLDGVNRVLSLANVEGFRPDPAGGIVRGRVVRDLPESSEAERALRERVLALDHLVGRLVSADGRATLVLCSLGPKVDRREVAERIRERVEPVLAGGDAAREGDAASEAGRSARAYWGGNPFVSAWIYETTQRDMRRLTPWAVGAILLLMLLAFRDVVGILLVLATTGIGIAVGIGSLTLAGASFNLVLAGMPVILFAVGSAYGIHLLARYHRHAVDEPPPDALRRTLTELGPTVVAAGLTSAAGLLSFVVMDIAPLRVFGVATAVGIGASLVLSLTFLPAVVGLVRLRGRGGGMGRLSRELTRLLPGVARRRRLVLPILGVLAACGATFSSRVEAGMDPRAFYADGSPPDRARRFLERRFGGSRFLQIHVEGDLRDPHALRELRLLADRLRLRPRVTDVMHVGEVIARANEAMTGERRIPDTRERVGTLFGLITGQPSLGRLVAEDRDEALMHVRLDATRPGEVEEVLGHVEQELLPRLVRRYRIAEAEGAHGDDARARRRRLVAARLRAVLHEAGVPPSRVGEAELASRLASLKAEVEPDRVAERLRGFLRSDEALVRLPEGDDPDDPIPRVARTVAALGPGPDRSALEGAVGKALDAGGDSAKVPDLAFALDSAVREAWRAERARGRAGALLGELELEDGAAEEAGVRAEIAAALLDLEAPTALRPARGASASEGDADGEGAGEVRTIRAEPTGTPLLHRGLSESVRANQLRSLFFALGVVLAILIARFRSLGAGLLGSVPITLVLLVVYGGMGALDIQLDIGTSMLASLILGIGVDYAVHLLSAWRGPAGDPAAGAARAAEATGSAIATNALAVGAGFFVLTLGQSKPLQNVGLLTAVAMITAAVATFVAIPALARRGCYAPRSSGGAEADASAGGPTPLDEGGVP